ncbi:hypothetical protein CEUSTIGMA_g2861.t1 [Chlamydomonas eustigma]|uniref:Uncharacterized protein n=1 Tax=Chlamydomonas eustigma TaxID=1157962 RepID=A0A250WX56_9CHLO|nr:hypothetical protein CEUSTIGMA_g2861.t1 [Chlamydomonas eustigma]|eukprot:GAX75417.1 hypothetical protein CEUSTIGMA_g2861.t1 [Chlamydomonas eustigma]
MISSELIALQQDPRETPSVAMYTGLDDRHLQWFQRHRPELLSSNSRLQVRLNGMAKLLHCNTQQAASILQKQPGLLDENSGVIRRRLSQLDTIFEIERNGPQKAAKRVPALLCKDINVTLRLAELERLLLGESESDDLKGNERVMHMIRKEPSLLILPINTLEQRVDTLHQMLDLGSRASAASLCLSNAWLLTVSSQSIASKLMSLIALLSVSRKTILDMILSYPRILTFSEKAQASKISSLSIVIPLNSLRLMLCRSPSLLTKSVDKILASFNTLQSSTGIPKREVIGLLKRRPAILSKAAASTELCYRAMSIWRLTREEKTEMIQKHPLLMQLSPRELHLRCRWLRSLITSNGYYHSGLRRISPSLLGIIILHLPQAWRRMQYLADCNQEPHAELMEAVQLPEHKFEEKFPSYKKWLTFKTSEMGCTWPWRLDKKKNGVGKKHASETRKENQSCMPSKQECVEQESPENAFNWHSAHNSHMARPCNQTVISEAHVVYYGVQRVHKPRRLVFTADPPTENTGLGCSADKVSAT